MSRNLKNNLLLPIFAAAVLITSCNAKDEAYHPPEMVTDIVPASGDNEQYENIYEGSGFNVNQEKPFVTIEENEVLITTLNLNLDIDSQEEQILVLRSRTNPEGKIFIAVADYSNVNNGYARVWQSDTQAENVRSFVVYLEDLIGDHNNEIVCSGRDSNGNTTLDVFWKNTTENKLGYIPIFSIATKGTAEINELERSKGYLQGLKNDSSYTITVTNEEIDEDENINLIETEYFWDFPVRKYVMLSRKLIENTVIRQKQLEAVIEGDEPQFYDFIEGPWYNGDHIIFFDPKQETATFFTDDIQENYSWANSYKVLSSMLYIRCKNEIINYIENEIYIKITDLNEISVTVRDIDNQTRTKSANDIWTNVYYRMDDSMMRSTVQTLDSVIDGKNLPVLSGQYISDSGDILEFYGSDFYFKNDIEEIKGGFAIYKADLDILNLKIIDDNDIVTEERTFAIDYTEEQKENIIERTIVLTPGTLSIYGFHPQDTQFYRFTQIETREIQEEDSQ